MTNSVVQNFATCEISSSECGDDCQIVLKPWYNYCRIALKVSVFHRAFLCQSIMWAHLKTFLTLSSFFRLVSFSFVLVFANMISQQQLAKADLPGSSHFGRYCQCCHLYLFLLFLLPSSAPVSFMLLLQWEMCSKGLKLFIPDDFPPCFLLKPHSLPLLSLSVQKEK